MDLFPLFNFFLYLLHQMHNNSLWTFMITTSIISLSSRKVFFWLFSCLLSTSSKLTLIRFMKHLCFFFLSCSAFLALSITVATFFLCVFRSVTYLPWISKSKYMNSLKKINFSPKITNSNGNAFYFFLHICNQMRWI